MPQNATSEKEQLTAPQVVALAALMEGRTVTDPAEAAGVDRTTVHRWLKADFAFIAAYNGAMKQLRDETQLRLVNVALRASETVERAVTGGNVQAALVVLRGLGLLGGRLPIGPDDPQELREIVETERHNAEMLRMLTRI